MDGACPQCGKDALHQSRPRSMVERLRRLVTGRVPFRCHACGWRGWRRTSLGPSAKPRGIHRDLTDTELERLDPDTRQGARRS